jgi:hypothetical protein
MKNLVGKQRSTLNGLVGVSSLARSLLALLSISISYDSSKEGLTATSDI